MDADTATAEAATAEIDAATLEAEEDRLESGTLRFTVVAPDGARLPIEVAVGLPCESTNDFFFFWCLSVLVHHRYMSPVAYSTHSPPTTPSLVFSATR
jgi:hypothetical protein